MRRTTTLMLAAAFLLPAAPGAGRGFQQPAPAAVPTETAAAAAAVAAGPGPAPSLRFVALGDMGTGDRYQTAVAKQMAAEYDRDPYGLVLMLGDNNYGGRFVSKVHDIFEVPYATLLDRGVRFYATLGNHDQTSAPEEMAYPNFHMGGSEHYAFAPAGDLVEFFTFDSTLVVEHNDTAELEWLDRALGESKARWKIVFLHHPPFSPGKRHGDNPVLDERLCPILEKHGVRVVLAGHEHFFAKMREKNGVDYIISGSGGKIQKGGIIPDPRMEAGNDRVHQFLSVRLSRDAFDYTVIADTGETIYCGSIPYRP